MPDTLRAAIVMSRLPRLIDPRATWLRGLRAALRTIQRQSETLVVVDGTAGTDLVRRGAERLSIPVEVVDVTDSVAADELIPARDRLLANAADTVYVLTVRANGNVHRALQERTTSGRVLLVDLPDLQSRSVRDDLLSHGAVLWSVPESDQVPFGSPVEPVSLSKSGDDVYEIVPIPSRADWAYLTHTTRACPGPWPGQNQAAYIDSLLDGSEDADHSSFAALRRILQQQMLIASPLVIREGHAVVCFTEISLEELPAMRRFRAHRTRWDFEPFGVCIRRDWLQARGARPVIYGDEAVWQTLPATDRPFFQRTSSPEDVQATDWSIEREWRHIGNLSLQDLPDDQAMVVVPDYQCAVRLADVCRWPITLWPDV